MSIAVDGTRTTHSPHHGEHHHGRPLRRVRQEARDALAVVAFSAAASVALAVAITVLVALAG
jgi:hypothetical protein